MRKSFHVVCEETEDRFGEFDTLAAAVEAAREAAATAVGDEQPVSVEHDGRVVRQFVRAADGRVVEEAVGGADQPRR